MFTYIIAAVSFSSEQEFMESTREPFAACVMLKRFLNAGTSLVVIKKAAPSFVNTAVPPPEKEYVTDSALSAGGLT